MVSAPEGCTNNSLIKPNPSMFTKNPSTRKLLSQFSDTLDFKHKTDFCRFDTDKANLKGNRTRNVILSNTAKRRGYIK